MKLSSQARLQGLCGETYHIRILGGSRITLVSINALRASLCGVLDISMVVEYWASKIYGFEAVGIAQRTGLVCEIKKAASRFHHGIEELKVSIINRVRFRISGDDYIEPINICDIAVAGRTKPSSSVIL